MYVFICIRYLVFLVTPAFMMFPHYSLSPRERDLSKYRITFFKKAALFDETPVESIRPGETNPFIIPAVFLKTENANPYYVNRLRYSRGIMKYERSVSYKILAH